MSAPTIPPRPSRSVNQQPAPVASMDPPKIPPRPSNRHLERSESPHRDSFPRSPLNETSVATNNGNLTGTLYCSNTQNASNSNLGLPHRPPSVSLPSVGQEGMEYADIDYDSSADSSTGLYNGSSSPTQTRNVGSDLPLHAPKPSLSSSNAKARVATVTRAGSHQAAAAGIGKAGTPVHVDDKDPYTRPLKSKGSFTRTGSSASAERPSSTQPGETELGIPEIGLRVPMYPNAGDVQAPSPSPFAQQSSTGIGFHNDGAHKPGRHHSRTRSGREVFQLPPGSYGLHGHGVAHPDKFEKAWYDKHPEALLREEHGQYGPGIGGGKGEWAMSSEDLNTIVRNTASRGAGHGKLDRLIMCGDVLIDPFRFRYFTCRNWNTQRTDWISSIRRVRPAHGFFPSAINNISQQSALEQLSDTYRVTPPQDEFPCGLPGKEGLRQDQRILLWNPSSV